MENNHGRTIETDTYKQRTNIKKNSIKIDCDSLRITDNRLHEEFAKNVRKGIDIKSKLHTLDILEIINFKNWYKMAYPDKYKSSKSDLNSLNLTPNKNENNIFSPENSKNSKNFNFFDNIEIFHNKKEKTNNKYINKNNVFVFNNLRAATKYKNKTIEPSKRIDNISTNTDRNSLKFNFTSQLTKKNSKKNEAELGLRKYYSKNKEKFLTKLFSSPPDSFRWISWIISRELPEHRSDQQFYSILKQKSEENVETQIEKDLHRTLTDDNLFSKEASRRQLFNVLKAFAKVDSNVAYCQGMNCIAGFILVVSNYNEVDAFYLMLSIFSFNSNESYPTSLGIRGFYLPEFPLLQLYLYQFDYIFYKKMPNLKKHFENLGIPNEAWVSKWFQTLYTICLPLNVVKRLWDCIFAVGLEFLFNFTLALLKHYEEDLIKFNDMIDLSEYLKSMNPYLNKKENKQKIDVEKIIEEAKMIVIPKNVIENLRCEYERIYKLDLKKINMIYSVRGTAENGNYKESNFDDSFGDCSFIDLTDTICKKESTISSGFGRAEDGEIDAFNASVSSEFDHSRKETQICDKVNTHILRLADMKKMPNIVRPASRSVIKNIYVKITNNKLKNNNTNSLSNHSNTTNIHVKSEKDGN